MEDCLYFFASYQTKKKEDSKNFIIINPEDKNTKIECIYSIEDFKNEKYYKKKVFKLIKSIEKQGEIKNHYLVEFETDDNKFKIYFDSRGKTFIYDISLEIGKKIIFDVIWKEIKIDLEYNEIMDLFISALEANGEKNKLEKLYKETLNIYLEKKEKEFSFLIQFFVKIYKYKDLCSILLNDFKQINEIEENRKYMDRKQYLKDYISKINEIKNESKKIIDINGYSSIEFYGIILCYLNFYDYNNFLSTINELLKENIEDLFEILVIYSSHFKNPIKQNLDFYNKFLDYIIENKSFKFIKRGFSFLEDIDTFIILTEKNKEKIYEKYIKLDNSKNFEKFVIKMDENLKLKKLEVIEEERKTNIFQLINKIKSIIDFSKEKKIFLIYFTNNFWRYLLNFYKDPTQDNILICFELRKVFIQYYKLVIELFTEEKNIEIKQEVERDYLRDEFSFVLDHMIKIFIVNNKDLSIIEKLYYIVQYNPYYIDHEKYYNHVDPDILNMVDINNIDQEFIDDFRRLNFELIFKNFIYEYISKFTSKIKNISNFDVVLKLINIENINDKNILLKCLNKVYDNLILPELERLNGMELNKEIKVIANLAVFNFTYSLKWEKLDFIKNKIKNFSDKIKHLIYLEIMNIFFKNEEKQNEIKENKDEEEKGIYYNEIKNFIFDEFLKKVEKEDDINNIITLIEFLERNCKDEKERKVNINKIYEEINDNFLFTKKEFFKNKPNMRIFLLYKLIEEGKIKRNIGVYYERIETLLNEIWKDLEGNILIKNLEEFLKNDKSIIIKRLSLIKLIIEHFDPNETFESLKNIIDKINQDLNRLKYIEENISLYYKETYKDIITQINDIIRDSKNKKIIEFKNERKIKELIKECEGLHDRAYQVEDVKNFLLFNVIYEINKEKDEIKKFDLSYQKLKELEEYFLSKKIDFFGLYKKYQEIFNKIIEKIGYNERSSNEFIRYFITKYNLTDKNLINDLNIIIKSKKYELDINSIIFFFEYFEKDNKEWNYILTCKDLSKKEFFEFKIRLMELRKRNIYDFNNIQNNHKLFICLYNKKEAIDYLFSKIGQDINYLIDRIDPTSNLLNIKDIIDTEECIKCIDRMKKIGDNAKILNFIKAMYYEIISKFENYSKKYSLIIELERNYDISEDIYNKIYTIINNELIINILQDTENLLYHDGYKNGYKNIKIEELISLKNNIQLNCGLKKKDNEEKEENIINKKIKVLILFKDIITNTEIIWDYMKVLRTKGSSLPITITIKITMKSVEYYLGEKIVDFENIRNFLFNAKNKYISQIDSLYKENINLRFLYGKHLRNMMKYFECGKDVKSFSRYILNNIDDNIDIHNGTPSIKRNTYDYINYYELYEQNSLENISTYITSLFKNNNETIESHYNKMKILGDHIYKGIYFYECENSSKKEFIIRLFLDKVGKLPISQNILITSKETTNEEIHSFFCRAILCNFNTLFVIELNDSFSEYQQNIMNIQINNFLQYKNYIYNTKHKTNIAKRKTADYLDSFIVFIFDNNEFKKNFYELYIKIFNYDGIKINNIVENRKYKFDDELNVENFINDEIKNNDKLLNIKYKFNDELNVKNFSDDEIKINDKLLNKKYEFDNIRVITSDISGLGKSGKIRKFIKDSNKKYFYFPLGGILTKNIICDKLKNLLNRIKNENYKKIAIHLDLYESNEKELLDDFFFSFLVTKFYINNEDIIYIPNDIDIYLEIPNCFDDYLSKFNILNIFNIENISFENMPEFDYPIAIIDKLNRILEINTNEKLKNFVKHCIGIKNCSYYQIEIFIKIFLSQLGKFNDKLKFYENQKDITEEIIDHSTRAIHYFLDEKLTNLLQSSKNKDIKYIDIFKEIFQEGFSNIKFAYPLYFIIKEKKKFFKLFFPENKKYGNSKEYLTKIKEVLDLPNEIEKDKEYLKSLISILETEDNKYVITDDNFKKMILLLYRIKANIPVIIMGETGCGKTSLVILLNQLLNNGQQTIEIINIHSEINDEILSQKMDYLNEKSKQLKNEELWIFFDEINTCLSFSLITEIFTKRTYNGNILGENIRLIGACRPLRKIINEKYGLNISEGEELIYQVQPLPQSLLYYIFSFGIIENENEKIYIHNIIEKLFSQEEKELHENTTEAISQCHIFLRKYFDPSIVSLRDIIKFSKLVNAFNDYFTKKNNYEKRRNNEKNNKLRSIICSIYLCYYIRLTDDRLRSYFEVELRGVLLKLVNNDRIEEKNGDIMCNIKNAELKMEILAWSYKSKKILYYFSDFIKIEEEHILNLMEFDESIVNNTLLRENIFLLFISIISNIPLIIIGKPGCGKSLSTQLIYKLMKGKYSKSKFFGFFPNLIQTYFQFSEFIRAGDIERIFEKTSNKLKYYEKNKLEIPLSMLVFNNLELINKSKINTISSLNHNLDNICKGKKTIFVGESNYTLEPSLMNRALVLSVTDIDGRLDDLIETSLNITKRIIPDKYEEIFIILSKAYFQYKLKLKFIKELVVYKKYKESKMEEIENNFNEKMINSKNHEKMEKIYKKEFTFFEIKETKKFKDLMKNEKNIQINFHGYLDFYNLIKGVAITFQNNMNINVVYIIEEYIERNFGGIEYKIDIDFDTNFEDIRYDLENIKNILEDYYYYNRKRKGQKGPKKLNSAYLFKKLYNLECDKMSRNRNLKIERIRINDYNLNKCIYNNIIDIESRYLLLGIKPSLSPLIYQYIKFVYPMKEISFYYGSPFDDDNNNEYIFKKINDILEDIKNDKLIILENLDQIQPFLYDLYNMNNQIIDNKKYTRIYSNDFKEKLFLLNEKLRIIILTDTKLINNGDLAFLNRFEKYIFSIDKLLNNDLLRISAELFEDIEIKEIIKKYENINYCLKDLLINLGMQEIQGLVYYFSKFSKLDENESDNEEPKNQKLDREQIKEKIFDKICNILPQDIIAILPEKNEIKKKYFCSKVHHNFRDYIYSEKNKEHKITIIYTFTNIVSEIESLNIDVSIMLSEIKSEKEFKHSIEEIKNKNENNKFISLDYICIHFDQSNSKYIKYISNYILDNFKGDKYNYIFIIHIKRNFGNFDELKHEKINFFLDINPDIYQLFIDNLNYNNHITLKDILSMDINDVIEHKIHEHELYSEFEKTLDIFVKNNIYFDKKKEKEYIDEISSYFAKEECIKDKILDKLKNNLKNNYYNDYGIIEEIYRENFINTYCIDLTSCIIEYIKEIIIRKNLNKIFYILEDNNIITTIIENQKKNYEFINKKLLEEIVINYLDNMNIDSLYFFLII